jgi:hypothetical protein
VKPDTLMSVLMAIHTLLSRCHRSLSHLEPNLMVFLTLLQVFQLEGAWLMPIVLPHSSVT